MLNRHLHMVKLLRKTWSTKLLHQSLLGAGAFRWPRAKTAKVLFVFARIYLDHISPEGNSRCNLKKHTVDQKPHQNVSSSALLSLSRVGLAPSCEVLSDAETMRSTRVQEPINLRCLHPHSSRRARLADTRAADPTDPCESGRIGSVKKPCKKPARLK